MRWPQVVLLVLLTACTPRQQPVNPQSLGAAPSESFLARPADSHVRLLAYNVTRGSFLPSAPAVRSSGVRTRPERLARVIRAAAPDIICLQEIETGRSAQVGARFDQIMPLENGAHWQTHQVLDDVIASRYPLRATAGQVENYKPGVPRAEAIATIDIPTPSGMHPLLVVCTHFQSSGSDADIRARHRHADHITTWLRDSLSSVGITTTLRNAPIVLLGDLNAYDTDPAAHVGFLIAGRLSTEKPIPDAPPLLTDAQPLHNARGPDSYTWRDDTQKFNPGRLDRILFNDQVLQNAHAFVINTATMTPAELKSSRLEREDVMYDVYERQQDHYPLVIDLRFR